MRQRPILFSAPMVRAILDGRKTQTRRIVQSPARTMQREGMEVIKHRAPGDPWYGDHVWSMRGRTGVWGDYTDDEFRSLCPYGEPGDRLWVRETWRTASSGRSYTTGHVSVHVEYREQTSGTRGPERGRQTQTEWALSDEEYDALMRAAYGSSRPYAWRPSIHMPRWASRITLEVTGVRVERLHDITEEDARAEGVTRLDGGSFVSMGVPILGAREALCALWRSTYGAASWNVNPWVWVVEFRRVAR